MKFRSGFIHRRLILAALVCVHSSALRADEIGPQSTGVVVMITGHFGETPTFGAGLIFGREKDRLYIVTADHVVRSGSTAAADLRIRLMTSPEKDLPAKLLAQSDRALDVAVLSVENLSANGIKTCFFSLDRLPAPDAAKRGDAVYPVGNPNGRGWNMPVRPDAISDVSGDTVEFQSTLIARGHSGGGLLTADGLLIAMIQADEPPYGRALKIPRLLEVLRNWKYPIDLNMQVGEGDTPLTRAVREDNVDEAKRLLSQVCTDANAKSSEANSWTPLQLAARRGRLIMAKLLIDAGAEVNAESFFETPLGLSAQSGNADLVQLLISHGAIVNANNSCCAGPLHLAAGAAAPDVVKVLLSNGADPNAEGYAQQTPIYGALRAKRDVEYGAAEEEILRALIQAGAKVNWTDRDGDTPLCLAAEFSQPRAVKILLEAGADASVKCRNEKPLISNARERKVVALVAAASSKINEQDGARLLDQCAQEGWDEVADLVIRHGMNVKGDAGGEALELAVENGHSTVVGVLLASGAKPGRALQLALNGVNAIQMDAGSRLEIVKLLVSKGAKVNVDPSPYVTHMEPLYLTLFRLTPPDLKIAAFLIAHGATVNRVNDEGRSFLDIARLVGNQDVVDFLLKAGARKGGAQR